MHSGKGVYALLLGSGVSRSSAIPTGWEVAVDLIRKLAKLKGESCDPDPEAWYRTLTGCEPDYSDILDQLTKSSAERGLLLRSYFEPTPEEREQGRKTPSPAHRAIALLVAKGYVRVIITTNFDRLMEQALTEAGVQPIVISNADAAQGALPLVHSRCTIMKVHGDYLDARIRNTRLELASYDKPLNDLLDRVFDEYGLVACGWSAEWDIALRASFERCSTHRFGTYWAARGALGADAEKLVALRRASVVPIREADAFFRELAAKVGALEDFALSDPVSAKVAVARMKRYIARPEERIDLHDLVNAEVERVRAAITSDRFSLTETNVNPEAVVRRLHTYESELHTLIAMLACGGYWSTEGHAEMLSRVVKRLADDATPKGGMTVWLGMKKYAALLAFYAMGIPAVASGNYGLLKRVFALKIRTDEHRPEERIMEVLTPLQALDHNLQKQLLPGREREVTPLNNHLFDALRTPLREYIPDESAYDDAFDTFEYLLGLTYCDGSSSKEDLKLADQPNWSIWGPIGRFIWNRRNSADHIQQRTRFESSGPYPELISAVVRAGLFGTGDRAETYERLRLVKSGFDAFVGGTRHRSGVW